MPLNKVLRCLEEGCERRVFNQGYCFEHWHKHKNNLPDKKEYRKSRKVRERNGDK